MNAPLSRFALAVFCGFVFTTSGLAATTSLWITGPMVKVLQTNTTPGSAQSLQIFAARNEFADFQVHALPTASPIQMNVTVSDFTNTQNGYVIPSTSNVFLYREAYLNITTPSDQNGTVGMMPDPLVPTVDPYGGEARNAFPVTVEADQTQSAWVDVLVPIAAPYGSYTGTVTISDGNAAIGELAVTLTVWDFTLPSTASLKSAFGVTNDPNGMCIQAYGAGSDGGYSECAQYPGSTGSPDTAIELIHRAEAMLALDHRIGISQSVYVGPPAFGGGNWTHFDATYADLLSGGAPTILDGAKLTTLQYTPPAEDDLTAGVIQNWVTHFAQDGWLAGLFDYTCDEPPNGCTWAEALSTEQAIHAGSTAMKTLITTDIANARQNGVAPGLNIIAPVVNDMEPQDAPNQRSSYDLFLNGPNKHLWWYQSCESHGSCSNGAVGPAAATYPSYMIDASPVRNRIFQWLAFLDRIEAELYYQVDYCWLDPGSACASSDPWTSVYAFGGNGDGTLLYPGTPAKIGGITPVAVPSIRFKLIRDGMQDYEYLIALSRAGHDDFARRVAAAFISNAYTFNNDPTALTAARQALGTRLNAMALGAAAPTVTAIAPASGPAAGGTSVTITGTNFNLPAPLLPIVPKPREATIPVYFGPAPAASAILNGPTSITAVAPAGSGTVDVTVTTSAGTSAPRAADQFAYQPTAPDTESDSRAGLR